MSVRTDVINLNVNVNGNQAQNQLNDLKKKAADARLEMDDLKKGTQAYIDKKKELSQFTAEMDNLKKQIGLTSLTQKELRQELTKLTALKGSVTPFTKEFKDLQKQIEAVQNRLYDVNNGVQGFASTFSKISDEVKQFGLMAAAYLGFEFITDQFSRIISGAGKISDSLADIRKSTGLTVEGVDAVNKEVGKFDTRTTNQSLRDLLVDAGKLGLQGKKDLLDFASAGDQINVALGEDLGKDAVKDIGKLVDIFRTKEEFGLKESMLKVGSAINDVGANSSASEGYIVDFLKRMGGIGPAAKIPLPDLIALAGTMDSLGQTSESSTTAIGNTISKLVTDFDGFAKIANVSGESLKQTFNEKGGLAALQTVLEGVKKSGGNFDELVSKLGDVGIEGAKAKGVFAVLANNLDVLDKQMGVSNGSYEKGISLTNEFNIKNATFGATLDKLGKEFNSLLTAPGITNFLKDAANGAMNFIKFMKELPQWLDENRTSLILLTGIVLAYVAAKTKATQASLLNRIATLLDTAADKLDAIQKTVSAAVTTAYGYAKDVLAGKIKLATVAQQIWNTVLKQNPLVWFIVILTAAAAAVSFLHKKFTELTDVQKLHQDIQNKANESIADEEAKIRSLSMVVGSNAISLEARKKALQELIAINPDYLSGLTLENIKTQEGINIIGKYVTALRQKAMAQAATDTQADKLKEDMKLQQIEYSLEKKVGSKKTDLSDLTEEEQGYVGSTRKNFNFSASVTDLATGDNAAKEALQAVKAQRAHLQVELDVTDKIIAANFEKSVENIDKGNASKVNQTGGAVSRTIKSIEDQIKSLDDAYKTIDVKNKTALKKNRDDRKQLQSELDNIEGKDPKKSFSDRKAESNYNSTLKEAENFHKKLEELKFKAQEASKTDDQKELESVKHKYEEIFKQYDGLIKKLQGKDLSLLGTRADISKAEQEELNAIVEKQKKTAFEKEQKAQKDNLSKAYTERQSQNNLDYEKERDEQAQRFVAGEISKRVYDSNIAAIDLNAKQDQLKIAEDFSALTVTLEGKIVPAVDQAVSEVTRLKRQALEKQTEDAIKAYQAQEAERVLLEKLHSKSEESTIQSKIAVATGKGDIDGKFDAEKQLRDKNRRDKQKELEQEKEDALKSITETGMEKAASEALIRTDTRNQLLAIDADYDAQELEADRQKTQAKIENYQKYARAAVDTASAINGFIGALENRQLQKEVAANDKKKKEFKKQLDTKLISQAQYTLETEKLDNDLDKKKKELAREQAKREKMINVFSAIINTSSAIAEALPNVPLSILAGVMGLAQVATIIATPLPELGTGDWIRNGDKHKDASGGIPVMIERDEAVMKADAMTDPTKLTVTGTTAQITSALNSRAGGINWAGGAVVQMPMGKAQRPASINPNMPRIMEQGGIVRPINPTASTIRDGSSAGSNDTSDINSAALIAAELKGMREDINNWNTKIKGLWVIKDLDDARLKLDNAKKASGLNQ